MRNAIFTFMRHTTASALICGLCLAGCEETEVPAIRQVADQVGTPSDGDGSARNNDCLMDYMYLVEGDQFTRLGGGVQSIERSADTLSGYSLDPDIEPRAKCRTSFHGYNGQALLLWNDVVVQEFKITKSFLFRDRVEVLAYEDPDGTRVELHIFAQPECNDGPKPVSTRAEIEALER